MMQSLFRFAPSPNGLLHLGHAYSAILNFEAAQRCGGEFLLRIEDIDIERCSLAFEAMLLEQLAWLGLAWRQPVRRQSEHFGDYVLAMERLQQQGLVYPCFCTRAEIARKVNSRRKGLYDPDGAPHYPGTCKHLSTAERDRRLASGAYAAQRLDMAEALAQCGTLLAWREYGLGEEGRDVRAEPMLWGDVVIARKDVPTSYHLAVVVDDALQGVTDVMRGQDLFAATSLHRLLQHLLGLEAPRYRHHPLILDATGRKLGKSRGSASLAQLRAEGANPRDIRTMVGLA